MESILVTIKTMLGIPEDYNDFDNQLVIYINSVLSVLRQIGVGNEIFKITGATETWNQLMAIEDDSDIDEVQTYIYMKVKMLFDPPTSSITMDALKQSIAEFEYRLNLQVDDSMEDE